jgi:hypothetical protein
MEACRNRIAKSGELIRPPVNLTSMTDVVQIDAALVNVEFVQDAVIACSQLEFIRSPPASPLLPSRSRGCGISELKLVLQVIINPRADLFDSSRDKFGIAAWISLTVLILAVYQNFLRLKDAMRNHPTTCWR